MAYKLGHCSKGEMDELSKKDVLGGQWIGKPDFCEHYV